MRRMLVFELQNVRKTFSETVAERFPLTKGLFRKVSKHRNWARHTVETPSELHFGCVSLCFCCGIPFEMA